MSPQSQARPPKPTTTYATSEAPSDSHAVEEADDWLEDIDSVLEENELEVVQRFIQKNGE